MSSATAAGLFPRQIAYQAQAEAVAAILWPMVIPQRAARAVGVEAPAAAADHLALFVVPVVGPFPDIAVHVEQTPRIRRKRADAHDRVAVLARRLSCQRKVAVVVGLARRQQLS